MQGGYGSLRGCEVTAADGAAATVQRGGIGTDRNGLKALRSVLYSSNYNGRFC